MTDTRWGRAVPNLMEMDTLPCRSRLMRASSGVLSAVRSKARRVYPALNSERLIPQSSPKACMPVSNTQFFDSSISL